MKAVGILTPARVTAMSRIQTTRAWYVEERARALAYLFLTRRDDLTIAESARGTDRGLDYLVQIGDGRGRLRRFGVVLRGSTRASDAGEANKALRGEMRVFHRAGAFPLPVWLLYFDVASGDGYCTWVAEPFVEDGLPRLRVHEEPACRPLTPQALDHTVDRVNEWYDAFHASLVPEAGGNGAGDGLRVLHGILDAESHYAEEHGKEPERLKLPAALAYDLAKLGREHLGDLSAKIVKRGIKALEEEGLFGMHVEIVRNSSKEIVVE